MGITTATVSPLDASYTQLGPADPSGQEIPNVPLGFYGVTPISQPHATAQAAVTDGSGGTAAATNGIQTITATYNSTIIANAFATLAAQGNAIQAALVSLGLIKGSN